MRGFNFSLVLSLILMITSTACTKNLETDIAGMIGQRFSYNPNNLLEFQPGKSEDENTNHKFKLIVYYDNQECQSCHAGRINNWVKLINKCKRYDTEILFFFNPLPKELHHLATNLALQRANATVFIDTCGYIVENNRWIPDNIICHTFLIDKNNNVVMVGDPRKK